MVFNKSGERVNDIFGFQYTLSRYLINRFLLNCSSCFSLFYRFGLFSFIVLSTAFDTVGGIYLQANIFVGLKEIRHNCIFNPGFDFQAWYRENGFCVVFNSWWTVIECILAWLSMLTAGTSVWANCQISGLNLRSLSVLSWSVSAWQLDWTLDTAAETFSSKAIPDAVLQSVLTGPRLIDFVLAFVILLFIAALTVSNIDCIAGRRRSFWLADMTMKAELWRLDKRGDNVFAHLVIWRTTVCVEECPMSKDPCNKTVFRQYV